MWWVCFFTYDCIKKGTDPKRDPCVGSLFQVETQRKDEKVIHMTVSFSREQWKHHFVHLHANQHPVLLNSHEFLKHVSIPRASVTCPQSVPISPKPIKILPCLIVSKQFLLEPLFSIHGLMKINLPFPQVSLFETTLHTFL